jgi:hypothetical protein
LTGLPNIYGGNLFNPLDELIDRTTGEMWLPLLARETFVHPLMAGEGGLSRMRMVCRYLAHENEFAINALENMVSFVAGTGITFNVSRPRPLGQMSTSMAESRRRSLREELPPDDDAQPAKGAKGSLPGDPNDPAVGPFEPVLDQPDPEVQALQEFVDEFNDEVLDEMQAEIIRRAERDGEVFVRGFPQLDGSYLLRFIEPVDVTSSKRSSDAVGRVEFGIETPEDDAESVLAYHIRGERCSPENVFHLKLNVDRNVPRGLPTFWPIRSSLTRAERLMRNMSVLAQHQASILGIRRHVKGTAEQIRAFADARADGTIRNPLGQSNDRFKYNSSRSRILDVGPNVEYEFPAHGTNPAAFIEVVKAELRAAAARLVFPEFMFTSDASNGNYASTLVAAGPPHRMFKRRQKVYGQYMLRILKRAVEVATGAEPQLKITSVCPDIEVHDQATQAQVNQVLAQNRILSRKTWSERSGLDYRTEQENIVKEALSDYASPLPTPPLDATGEEDPNAARQGGEGA